MGYAVWREACGEGVAEVEPAAVLPTRDPLPGESDGAPIAVPLANPDALRLFPEHWLIGAVVVTSFVSALWGLRG